MLTPFTAYEDLMNTMALVRQELDYVASREGLPEASLTGNIWVDQDAELVWFEISGSGYLSWVTPDAPEHAAHGETLNAAASREEARTWGAEHTAENAPTREERDRAAARAARAARETPYARSMREHEIRYGKG